LAENEFKIIHSLLRQPLSGEENSNARYDGFVPMKDSKMKPCDWE